MESSKSFGKSIQSEFLFELGFININNGSFGSCPKSVLAKKRTFQMQMYRNPERWHRQEAEEIIKAVRQQTSKIVKAPASNIFIVSNTSTGANSFLRSIDWKEGDVILALNTYYESVEKVLTHLELINKVSILKLKFTKKAFQSPQSVLEVLSQTLQKEERVIKLAIIDHISSKPSIIFPVQQISAYLHEKDIPFLIDGAHAFGHVDIDIQKLKPAGYISNYHKWGYVPTSAAFLYVSPKYISRVYPTTIGNNYGTGKDKEYFWEGTRDITSFCTISEGIKFLQLMKEKGKEQYCQKLCQEATDLLSKLFKTEPLTKYAGFNKYMNNIELPYLNDLTIGKVATSMLQKFNFFPVIFNFDGKTYWRISTQVYNELSDYEFAGQKLKEVIDHIYDE